MKITKSICTLAVLFSIVPAGFGQAKANAAADVLIVGGTIVTMDKDRRVIEDGAVAIKDGKIVAIGTRAERCNRSCRAKQTINAAGKVIIPGLINTHTHVPMSLFRGISDDLDLQDWLTKYIFPAEAKNVDEAFVRAGTRLGLAEMIRGGTTTYCDMYYFEDAIADETKKAGVRGVLGETIIDFPVADNKTNAEAMAYTERFIKKWQNDPLIVPALAPHAPYTVSTEHLKAIRALSDKLNAAGRHPRRRDEKGTRRHQETIRRHAGRLISTRSAFSSNRMIAAHTVWITDEEIDILKRVGVGVGPQSAVEYEARVGRRPGAGDARERCRRRPRHRRCGVEQRSQHVGRDGHRREAAQTDLGRPENRCRPNRPLRWRRSAVRVLCISTRSPARSRPESVPTSRSSTSTTSIRRRISTSIPPLFTRQKRTMSARSSSTAASSCSTAVCSPLTKVL